MSRNKRNRKQKWTKIHPQRTLGYQAYTSAAGVGKFAHMVALSDGQDVLDNNQELKSWKAKWDLFSDDGPFYVRIYAVKIPVGDTLPADADVTLYSEEQDALSEWLNRDDYQYEIVTEILSKKTFMPLSQSDGVSPIYTASKTINLTKWLKNKNPKGTGPATNFTNPGEVRFCAEFVTLPTQATVSAQILYFEDKINSPESQHFGINT